MHELSLHILDLIENSIRGGASTISVTVEQDSIQDLLKISIEDNGSGLQVPPEVAANPFYTTKEGKRMGLGLSLFQAAAEQAGGTLTLGKSALGGLIVTAAMRLTHIDRNPLGNLAATLSTVACTNPQIQIRCRLRVDEQECIVIVTGATEDMELSGLGVLTAAQQVGEEINSAIVSLKMST